jgi:hypothetical protein
VWQKREKQLPCYSGCVLVVCRKDTKHAKKKDKRLKKKEKIHLCVTLWLCGKKEKSSYPVISAES